MISMGKLWSLRDVFAFREAAKLALPLAVPESAAWLTRRSARSARRLWLRTSRCGFVPAQHKVPLLLGQTLKAGAQSFVVTCLYELLSCVFRCAVAEQLELQTFSQTTAPLLAYQLTVETVRRV